MKHYTGQEQDAIRYKTLLANGARIEYAGQRIIALESSYLRLGGLGQWRVFIDVIGAAGGHPVNIFWTKKVQNVKRIENVENTKNNENVNDAGKQVKLKKVQGART